MMITGRLKRWVKHTNSFGHYYYGNIYDDVKGRFRDGTRIHTSQVEREQDCGNYTLVYTLNSLYILFKDDVKGQDDGTSGNMLGP